MPIKYSSGDRIVLVQRVNGMVEDLLPGQKGLIRFWDNHRDEGSVLLDGIGERWHLHSEQFEKVENEKETCTSGRVDTLVDYGNPHSDSG